MQIMENTAQEITNEIGVELEGIDLKDPECNIEIGTKYFKALLDYYGRKLSLSACSI